MTRTMKRSFLLHLGVASLVLLLGATGCKKPQVGITPLDGGGAALTDTPSNPTPPIVPGGPPGGGIANGGGATGEELNPLPGRETFEGMVMDPDIFAAQTVHFDFDSSVVKIEDIDKVNAVGDELKLRPNVKLLVDGHCDERGTEEYNRSLGERRALAVRQVLIDYGVDGNRIRTRSWGEDKPVDPGHDENAWKQNRRAEFIMLLPPGQ